MSEFQIGDRVRLAKNGQTGKIRYKYKGRQLDTYGVVIRWDMGLQDVPYMLPSPEIVKDEAP
jgi:hypothetical protein